MTAGLGKPHRHQLKSSFCPQVKGTLMHYPETPCKYLAIDGQVCFYRRLFADAVKPRRCMHVMVLGRVNRTAWGTKLLLTAVWAYLVDFTSSRHLLKTQHCSLSPNGCFAPPSAPHPPPPSTPIESIHDITGAEKSHQKTSSIQVACWNSYKMLAI